MKYNESEWLDYIMKLNDRELNRRQTSGFTSWAILGLIALLLFKLLDGILIIFKSYDSATIFFIYSAVMCDIALSVGGIVYLPSLFHDIELRERRIYSEQSKRSFKLLIPPLFVILLLAASINFYVWISSSSRLIISWPYLIFGIFFLLQAFGDWISKKYMTRKLSNKNVELPEIRFAPLSVHPTDKILSELLIGINMFLCLACFLIIVGLAGQNLILTNIQLIKLSTMFVTILVALLIYFKQFSIKVKFSWLEILERRIIVEELSSKEIRSLFVKEFLGETALDWINSIQDELNKKYKDFITVFDEAEKEIASLEQIDKQYTFEIKGRITDICQKLNNVHEEFNKYSLAKIEQIEVLMKQSPLNSNESLALKAITSEWKEQSKQIRTMHDKICKVCKENNCSNS